MSLSLSVGVASFDDSCATLSDLLAHCDRALRAAKEDGSNQVRVHDPLRADSGPPADEA